MATIIRRLAFESALLAHLDEIGVDHRAWSSNEALRGLDRNQRLHRLAGFAICETNDPLLGVKVGRRVPLAGFGALGHAILSAPTLRHAMRLTVKHQGIVQPQPRNAARVTHGKGRVYLEFLHPIVLPESPTFLTDMFLASSLQQMRQLTDPGLKGFEVEVNRRLPDRAAYEAVMGVPVRDKGEINRLSAPTVLATARLPGAFGTQSEAYTRLAENALADVDAPGGIARSVETILLETDAAASVAEVALRLGLSERTLRRRLHAAGTSFADVWAGAQFELARAYLRNLPVRGVAEMMGYHDASTFRRAFRRWSGSSPAKFAAAQAKG